MKKQNDYSWCSPAMEKLKQKVIVDNLAEIDLDNEIDLYDKLISELVNGNLDSVLDCPACSDLSQEESKQLLAKARKYLPLCFSRGDISRWIESTEGVSLGDYELICMKILDNYNFILNQLKDKREYALDRLMNFSKYGYGDESSTIERIRGVFYSDEALDQILARLAIKDGEYSRFSDEHMSILCSSPEGVLYIFDENKKPVLYKFSDIQVLITNTMKELDLDEMDENYFLKVVSYLFMEYSEKLYEIVFSNQKVNLIS